MSEKVDVYKGGKIKFKGILDLGRMYSKIKEWLEDEDFSVKEDLYIERIRQNGKDIEIIWNADQEKNKYIGWEAKITIYITGANETEIEQDGKRLKMSQCTTEVKFEAWQINNKDDEFGDKSFFKVFYEKFIIGDKIEEEKINLFKKMQDLVSEFKTFLALYKA